MTTCISGHPSQYTLKEPTIAVLKWPSFKNGNPDPFICQFFHPKKDILKKLALNTNAQFGLATLWRRAKHKFTPTLVRQILTSERFQNRLEPWTIIHALGSNTRARFEQTKMLRSNDGGLTLCYALRRLASNIQEPFRTLSLNAIDASIKWCKGKPAPRATALRAPWSLTPNLQQQFETVPTKVAPPSSSIPSSMPHTIFSRWSSSNMQLFWTNSAITSRPSRTGTPHNLQRVVAKSGNLSKQLLSIHQILTGVLAGSLLHSLVPEELAVIAEGSLLNKVFPSKKEYQNQLKLGLHGWTKRNGLPSMPNSEISDFSQHLWTGHSKHVTCHITKSSINSFQKTFEGAIFHCEDKQASSLRIYCPCLYTKPLKKLFRIPPFSNRSPKILNPSSHRLSIFYTDNMENPTLGR